MVEVYEKVEISDCDRFAQNFFACLFTRKFGQRCSEGSRSVKGSCGAR